MLDSRIEDYYNTYHLDRVNVLLVQSSFDSVVELTDLLIETGVNDTRIFNANSYAALEKYLETGVVTHIILDASKYNFGIISLIKQYSQIREIKVYVNNADKVQKTIRLITDKGIKYLKSDIKPVELNQILADGDYDSLNYTGLRKIRKI